ncbi:MAG: MFS transporter [Anaerolineae bacterium]|nr:MFS transporter [Chloroflexota bacterium]
MAAIVNNPLVRTLRELRGNPRACVLTEPMFGVPYNLYMPFMSVYMLALGVTDRGIGTLASLGLLSQLVATWLSGAIVDKFGRRVTVLVADIISFGVACLIWAAAQNAVYFVVAALINGLWRIAHTAWTCLMIEDAEEHHLVHIWTWISLFGMSASFLTPIGGWVVNRFGLVPAMRGLLAVASVMLTAKAVVLYFYSHETERGIRRMEETRQRSVASLVGESHRVFGQLLRSRPIMAALALLVVTNVYRTVNTSFWGVLFTSKLGFPDAQIAIYMALRSIVMAVCLFLVSPRLTSLRRFRLPLWTGFGAYFVAQGLLVFMPPRSVPLLVLSVLLEAFAAALVNPMTESLLTVSLETHERARLTGLVYVLLILATTPFGWIAGQLSAIDRALPFALLMVFFALGMVLVWAIHRWQPSLEGGAEG